MADGDSFFGQKLLTIACESTGTVVWKVSSVDAAEDNSNSALLYVLRQHASMGDSLRSGYERFNSNAYDCVHATLCQRPNL